MKKLFLLDAYALIYRSYYALIRSPRINSKGMNTSAVMGFVNTLNEVITKERPDYLGVAFADEGYDLRAAGISLPIIVMNPEPHSFDLMLKHDLEPQIYGYDELTSFSEVVRRSGVTWARQSF